MNAQVKFNPETTPIYNFVKGLYKNIKDMLTPKMDYSVYRELSRLTDKDLSDMGICRGDIRHIARGEAPPRDGWRH